MWRRLGGEGLLCSSFPRPLLRHMLLTEPSDCWPLCPSTFIPPVFSKHPMSRDKGYIGSVMGKARGGMAIG